MRDAQTPERVEGALLAAFRERRAVAPAVTFESVRARRDATSSATMSRRALFAAAVAASLVVASVVVWRTLSAKTPVVVETSQKAGKPEMKSANITRPTDITRAPGAQPTAPFIVKQNPTAPASYIAHNFTRRRAPKSVNDLPISFTEHGGRIYADAVATNGAAGANDPGASADFVPLMTADGSTPLEGGQMVRVRMPRAALAAWGLPVNAERAGEMVKADLLLAHDGTARAVRLRP
jgi:hypothetical protein